MAQLAHSDLGGSAMDRLAQCALFRKLQPLAPPNEDTVFSIEGDAAHHFAELALSARLNIQYYVGREYRSVVCSQEMSDYLRVYTDTVYGYLTQYPDAMVWFECHSSLRHIHPDFWGTADCVIYIPSIRCLIVIDLKYGYKIVDIGSTLQLPFYALGIVDEFEREGVQIDNVVLGIVQPRPKHTGGPVRTRSMTRTDFEAYRNIFEGLAVKVENNPNQSAAGKQCLNCPCAGICPTLNTDVARYTKDVPQPLHLMDQRERGLLLERNDVIKNYLASFESYCEHLARIGRPTPGRKLVQKKGNRRIKDFAAFSAKAQQLGVPEDMLYQKKEKSPAQLEKSKIHNNLIDEFTDRDTAGTAYVTMGDKRPPVSHLDVLQRSLKNG